MQRLQSKPGRALPQIGTEKWAGFVADEIDPVLEMVSHTQIPSDCDEQLSCAESPGLERAHSRPGSRSSPGMAGLSRSNRDRPARFHRVLVLASSSSILSSIRKRSSARRSQSRSKSASSSNSKIATASLRRSVRDSFGSSAIISDALIS